MTQDTKIKPENPLMSYARHLIVVLLMKLNVVPAEGFPEAAQWVADAVVLAVYWGVVKYGSALLRNRALPWLDKVSGKSLNSEKL